MLIHTSYPIGFLPRTPEFLQLAFKPSGPMKKPSKLKAPSSGKGKNIKDNGAKDSENLHKSSEGSLVSQSELENLQKSSGKLNETKNESNKFYVTRDIGEAEVPHPPPVVRHASVWNCCGLLKVLKGFQH